MAQPSQPSYLDLTIKGLYLNPSTFGNNVPNGALNIANNVVIDRPSVVATRRGFDNTFATIPQGVDSIFQYASTRVIHTGDDKIALDPTSGTFVNRNGTYPVPNPSDPASRIRAIEANKNFYFITENGTYRLDSPTNLDPRLAGAPPGLSGFGSVTGASGFLPATTNVAYRVVFGYKDLNSQLILGAPSSRIVVSNPGATSANVSLTFQQPKEIQATPTNFFYQVYRSNASPDLATQPDDEMALVYEDICSGSSTITITDIVPDNLKGAALYTNVGQQGILNSNYRPPWCTDIALFKGFTFYANTRNIHTADFTLISAGASNGPDALVPGDTVTFVDTSDSSTFTLLAVSTPNNESLGWFNVSNTGNPAYDIQVTASNLALVANAYASNTFLSAYYTSTDTELPGKLRFDKLSFNQSAFTITSSRSTCWQQPLPVTSVNDVKPNRLYYSKFNEPEAVPVLNYLDVGSANAEIVRILPLRDGLMVLKLDGIFRISNGAPPFNLQPIDFNVRILAPNTAAELDNKIYFLSDQGIVALSDSDAEIKSFVLDKTIIENTSPLLFPNLRQVAWGLAYQSDRKYILFMPSSSGDLQSTQQYVYNHITDVWTRWTLQASCGMIFRRDGRMYLGSVAGSAPGTNQGYVYQERKNFTNADYVDSQYTASNTTVGYTDIITITNPLLPNSVEIQEGWTIQQSSTSASARVVSVSVGVSFTVITLDRKQMWDNSDVNLYVPIYSEVQTVQIDCENPGMNKQYNEIVYVFTEQGFTKLDVKYTSDTSNLPGYDVIVPNKTGGWGIDPWGISPWGGSFAGQGKVRRFIPQKIQRSGWLNINIKNAQAFTGFGWSGAQIYFKNTSTRQF